MFKKKFETRIIISKDTGKYHLEFTTYRFGWFEKVWNTVATTGDGTESGWVKFPINTMEQAEKFQKDFSTMRDVESFHDLEFQKYKQRNYEILTSPVLFDENGLGLC